MLERIANLVLLSSFITGLTSCGWQKASSGCPNGPGLATTPFNGAQLAEKQLALTFNRGPTEFTQDIADFLYANGVRAAFFAQGSQVPHHKSQLLNAKSREHLVANLTYSYSDLTKAKDPVLEVRKTDELIYPYVAGNIFLLRAPAGEFNEKVAEQLNLAGLGKYVGPIQYDIGDSEVEELPDPTTSPNGSSSIDFMNDLDCWRFKADVPTCADSYLDKIRATKKGIVLLHDTTEQTFELVKVIVPALKNEGYSFLRVDELPHIRSAIEAAGGSPGTIAGAEGCNDYK